MFGATQYYHIFTCKARRRIWVELQLHNKPPHKLQSGQIQLKLGAVQTTWKQKVGIGIYFPKSANFQMQDDVISKD